MFDGILPNNFIASTTEVVVDLMSALHGYIILILGVMLAVTAIGLLISYFTHHNK